jgi:hypothetical protein
LWNALQLSQVNATSIKLQSKNFDLQIAVQKTVVEVAERLQLQLSQTELTDIKRLEEMAKDMCNGTPCRSETKPPRRRNSGEGSGEETQTSVSVSDKFHVEDYPHDLKSDFKEELLQFKFMMPDSQELKISNHCCSSERTIVSHRFQMLKLHSGFIHLMFRYFFCMLKYCKLVCHSRKQRFDPQQVIM